MDLTLQRGLNGLLKMATTMGQCLGLGQPKWEKRHGKGLYLLGQWQMLILTQIRVARNPRRQVAILAEVTREHLTRSAYQYMSSLGTQSGKQFLMRKTQFRSQARIGGNPLKRRK